MSSPRYLLHTANGLTGRRRALRRRLPADPRAVKVVLVVALLLNKLWAYPWMIVVLLMFIGYQLYRIALQPDRRPDRPHPVRCGDRRLDLARIPPTATGPEDPPGAVDRAPSRPWTRWRAAPGLTGGPPMPPISGRARYRAPAGRRGVRSSDSVW